MATLPLDIDDLLSELNDAPADPDADRWMPSGTRIGHMHLQVSDIEQSEHFYAGVLGFDVTVRGYPGALFVSAGGYHHHIGMNTWNSRGAAAPTPGSVGLRSFELRLGDAGALEAIIGRVRDAGLSLEPDPDGVATVRDPSGNLIRLIA